MSFRNLIYVLKLVHSSIHSLLNISGEHPLCVRHCDRRRHAVTRAVTVLAFVTLIAPWVKSDVQEVQGEGWGECWGRDVEEFL